MYDVRRRIVTIVERHLDEILEQLMTIYADEITVVANADEARLRRIRGTVRKTLLAFLGIYADPASPARALLEETRSITVERAGEEFTHEDIVAMLRIARHVMFGMTRAFVTRELTLDEQAEPDLNDALEAFLLELERPQIVLDPVREAVGNLLAYAESSGQDLH